MMVLAIESSGLVASAAIATRQDLILKTQVQIPQGLLMGYSYNGF